MADAEYPSAAARSPEAEGPEKGEEAPQVAGLSLPGLSVGSLPVFACVIYIIPIEKGVAVGTNEPFPVVGDQDCARRREAASDSPHATDVDALGGELIEDPVAESIVTDASPVARPCAESRDGNARIGGHPATTLGIAARQYLGRSHGNGRNAIDGVERRHVEAKDS